MIVFDGESLDLEFFLLKLNQFGLGFLMLLFVELDIEY